ncbi:hypothetical protein V8E52_003096 [Russula decolorans]
MFLPNLFSLSHELLIEYSPISPPLLLQYISRTALSGVFDPLEPGLFLPERLDALERWETAWMEMNLASQSPSLMCQSSPKKYDLSRGYAFLEMHAGCSSHINSTHWMAIEFDTPNILALAFALELNLAVAVSWELQYIRVTWGTYLYRPPEDDLHDQLVVLQYWEAAPIGIPTQFGGYAAIYEYIRCANSRPDRTA